MATNFGSIVDAQALEDLEAARTAHSMTPTLDLPLRFPDVNLAIVGSGNTRYWGSTEKTTFYDDYRTYLGGFIGSRSITLGNQEDLEYIWSRSKFLPSSFDNLKLTIVRALRRPNCTWKAHHLCRYLALLHDSAQARVSCPELALHLAHNDFRSPASFCYGPKSHRSSSCSCPRRLSY